MRVNFDILKDFFLKDAYIISTHARVRMFQRNISTEDIENVIAYREMIEDYPDDEPCPSALFIGFTKGIPCHIVVAQ